MEQELNLLVVDDDADDFFLIKNMLDRPDHDYKFNLAHCLDLESAMNLLKSNRFELVLLDLALPDCRDFEGLQKIKDHDPAATIIILTGRNDQKAALQAMKSGASDYLLKSDLNRSLLSKTLIYSYERQKLADQLKQAQKMETIGQLTSGIAHDFNNQLTLMCLLVSKAQTFQPENRAFQKIIDEFHSVIESCNYMTKKILSFSRKQALSLAVIDVNLVIEQMLPFIRRLFGGGIVVQFTPDVRLKPVKTDKVQLEQAVWNLLLNARDALKNDRRIHIRTRQVDETGMACVEVEDHGCGISQSAIEKIFDPFFTTKPVGIGTGLGLAMVRRFVQESGGKVSCESQKDRGTCFKIFLPNSQEPLKKEASPGESELLYRKHFALVCDDEELLRDLVVEVLEESGFEVLAAASGEEAMEIFEKNKDKIDLLVTDIGMPGIDGLTLTTKIRAIKSDMKVLIVTGMVDAVDLKESRRKNTKCLAKPFSIHDLMNATRTLINGHTLTQ